MFTNSRNFNFILTGLLFLSEFKTILNLSIWMTRFRFSLIDCHRQFVLVPKVTENLRFPLWVSWLNKRTQWQYLSHLSASSEGKLKEPGTERRPESSHILSPRVTHYLLVFYPHPCGQNKSILTSALGFTRRQILSSLKFETDSNRARVGKYEGNDKKCTTAKNVARSHFTCQVSSLTYKFINHNDPA